MMIMSLWEDAVRDGLHRDAGGSTGETRKRTFATFARVGLLLLHSSHAFPQRTRDSQKLRVVLKVKVDKERPQQRYE